MGRLCAPFGRIPASVTMRMPSLLCVLAASVFLLLTGCGGESAESRMRKMAKAQAELNKEKEAKAAAMSGGLSPDSAGGGASLPKSSTVTTPSAATLPSASANQHMAPAAITTPSAALGSNATVEQRRARTMENLAKLGRALNAYADSYAGYPTTKTVNAAAYPQMSWRVSILPLLGYEKLFKQYRPTEPWDSAANKQVLAQIPPEFASPDRRDTKTNYLVPLGFEAAFGCGRRLNAGMFDDGPDYTLIVVEVDDSQAVEWTRPDDLVVQAGSGGSARSKLGSLRGDGFFAVLGNGRVCRIKSDADELALKALFTVSSGDTELIKDAIQDATAVPVPPPEPVATANNAPVEPPPVASPKPATPGNSVAGGPAPSTVPRPAQAVPYAPDDEPASTLHPLQPLASVAKKKIPVPSESELAVTRATLKELYAADYKKAPTAQDRRQLAQKLVVNSREVGEDHAAEYELLRIARDLSAQNGDLTDALKSLAQMAERFEVDVPTLRLETLKLFQKSPDAQAKDKELAAEARKLVAEAVEADEYDVALEALKIEKGAAKRGGETEHLTKAGKMQTWLEAAKRAYLEVSKAEARLTASSSDPQANQTVGTYTCLVKGRWEQGLSLLTKAADRELRLLATLDLTTSKSPQEVFNLANQYWDLAEHKPDLEEKGLKLRAAYWYSQATRQLPNGLDKIKSRKRLAEIIEAYGKEETEKAAGRSDLAAAAAVTSDE